MHVPFLEENDKENRLPFVYPNWSNQELAELINCKIYMAKNLEMVRTYKFILWNLSNKYSNLKENARLTHQVQTISQTVASFFSQTVRKSLQLFFFLNLKEAVKVNSLWPLSTSSSCLSQLPSSSRACWANPAFFSSMRCGLFLRDLGYRGPSHVIDQIRCIMLFPLAKGN